MTRTERQVEEDNVAYLQGVDAYEKGWQDGFAGRPADGDEHHYAAGHDDGRSAKLANEYE